MPSGYPAAIDNFTNPTGVDNLSDAPVLHHSQHTNVNDAVKAIETELGVNPKGTAASVVARLNAIDTALSTKMAASAFHQPFGVATLDSGSMLVENVDASKITAGTINVARIPNLSGAKILGTGSGGAAIPLDAVPNLPASKTTSGTFGTTQIPSLDASKITTGIFDPARIPTSISANANSREVADVAAMNAIPAGERVDGLIVTVRTPWTQYTYRADNGTFVQSGGPGFISEGPIQTDDQTDYLNLAMTTFNAGVNCGFTFKAPQSGKIKVTVTAHMSTDSTGYCYLAWELRSGNVLGSGTVIHAANTEDGVGTGGAANIRIRGSAATLVPEVLTAGNDYNIRCMYLVTSGTFDVFSRQILVEMMH
jgi:hypothetical protein